MSRPFSAQVTDSDWREQTSTWIAANLEGREIIDIEQTRVRPWSAQLRIETDAGAVWFKANCSSQAFEGRLQSTLAALLPEYFDAPLALHPDQGWFLTVDRGSTWKSDPSSQPSTRDRWITLLAVAARIQNALTHEREVLLATGMPDCQPSSIVDRFDRLTSLYASFPEGHPAHLSSDAASRVETSRAKLVAAVQQLATSRLRPSWNHADLHPGNITTALDGMRIFDLGDSQWTHPMEILCVPYAVLSESDRAIWPEVFAAYSDVWQLSPDVAQAEWAAVQIAHGVNRSATWMRCLDEASAEDWQVWGDAPLNCLKSVLEL